MRPTAAAARYGVMAIATLILFLPSSVAVQAQDEIVARGNAAYQEGDFAAAVEAYEAVLESGYRSAGLEYNLANAYFKTGELGRAILHWERALELAPGDEDIQANLDLARSLTVDAVEPLPRFWLFSVMDWWIGLLPAGWLRGIVAVGWLAVSGGVILRVLGRAVWVPTVGRSLIAVGSLILLLFAPVMTIRETGLGLPEEAIILAGAVQVRSAPSAEDDLTLFEIHEGTKVRVDQRTAEWLEVVLEDGKVGWVPVGVLEVI
ncbi:MAG: tetratricopeptide repeat protein [Gemmatimonadetes bacterium]|nr:tetratricopeptide repeat protein [Gemmatimonadota bacterium]